MHLRFVDDGRGTGERPSTSTFVPARAGTRQERMREIRRRLADDAYRSEAVVDEIARRILLSREL